jgi:hypothetical protein
MSNTFREFVDRKTREAKKHLGTLKKILKRDGMEVKDFLEEEDPYIYVANPIGNLSFDGVRIYKIGGEVAYRIQKEDKTHPYGKAYVLDVEGMFHDLLSDNIGEQKAGEEFKKFFSKSSEAEKDLRASEFDYAGDSMKGMVVNPSGTDYSNTVHRSYSPF